MSEALMSSTNDVQLMYMICGATGQQMDTVSYILYLAPNIVPTALALVNWHMWNALSLQQKGHALWNFSAGNAIVVKKKNPRDKTFTNNDMAL